MKTHNQFEVDLCEEDNWKSERFNYMNSYSIDIREETYYKTVEYAQGLFLGVKDE